MDGNSQAFLAELFGIGGLNDPAAFANRDDLIRLHLGESFDLLRGRPLYLDGIHGLGLSQPEVKPQIALGHHA